MKSFRRLFRFFGLLLIAGHGIATVEAQTPPVRIMPLGDSITQGYSATSTVQGGYRNKLYNSLTAAGYNVDYVGTQSDTDNPAIPDWDHQGMGGYRIDMIDSGLGGWFSAVEDPDVILLLIGVNDFWQNYNLATVQTRFANLITDIATQRPFARIIVSNLTLRTDSASLEAQQVTFNAALPGIVSAQVALGRHVTLVDMHSALSASDLSDGVHPTITGYGKLADVWLPAVTSVITPLGTADPPAIVRTEPATDLQHVSVRFSKPLADSAATLANFSITGGLSLTQAVLDATSKRIITLTTSAQTPGTLYTIGVSGVQDRTPQQTLIASGATVQFSSEAETNGSFESGLAGWTSSGNLEVKSGSPYVASNGANLVAFNTGNSTPNGVLSQAFATASGQSYTLTFDAGVLAYNTNPQTMLVTVTGSGSASLLSQTITLKGLGGGATLWASQSFTFVPNSATSTVTFHDQSASTNNLDLLLDNVRITRSATGPNTPPVAVADAYSTSQNATLAVAAPGVLANDTDAQANPLTAVLNVGPSNGSLALNADGSFTYTPTSGYSGADSFTYHANDGSLDSNIVTVAITVTASGASILANGSFESDFTGWTVTGNVFIELAAAPYTSTDGSKLVVFNGGQTTPNGVLSQTFATVAGQTYTLAFDAGVLAYNKNPQTLGVTVTGSGSLLSQTITINGLGGGATHWVSQSFTFVANSTTATLTFKDQSTSTNNLDLLLDNVRVTGPAGVNTAPVAVADAYSAIQNTALAVAAPGVLANDTDAQANPLTAVLNVGPSHGSLALNADGSFTYTPASGYSGADSFTYHANDGSLDSNIATVSITVNALVAGSLVNGSFESGYTGWTATGNQSVESASPYVATNGSYLVEFNGGQTTPNGVLSQAFATGVGQTYTLTFDLGVLAYNKNSQTMLVTVTGTGSLLSQSITLTGLGGGATRWVSQSFTFVANSATSTLTFKDQSTTTNNIDLLLDNVQVAASALVAAVPPATGSSTGGSASASAQAATAPAAGIGTPQLLGSPGAFTIRMTAQQAGLYVLERSPDLTTWEYVSERQCAAQDLMEFQDAPAPLSTDAPKPQMFYRIGLQPVTGE